MGVVLSTFCTNTFFVRQKCGNHIVSHLSENLFKLVPGRKSIKRVSQFQYCHSKKRNKRDHGVPGVTVFRAYEWSRPRCLGKVHLKAIKYAFPNKGLARKTTKHFGTFVMCGAQKTCQASGAMNAPSSHGTEHDYRDPKTGNSTIKALLKGYLNKLGEQAKQHASQCGAIGLALIAKALAKEYKKGCRAGHICQGTIITYNFFNTPHRDDDTMSRTTSDLVKNYINELKSCREETPCSHALKQWLESVEELYGSKHTLSMQTTCCWMLHTFHPDYLHLSYFVLLESNVAYDLSSDILRERQNGATFYGKKVTHCTSVSVWVNKEGTHATLKCPEDGLYNFAWGEGGQKSNDKKKRDEYANGSIRVVG